MGRDRIMEIEHIKAIVDPNDEYELVPTIGGRCQRHRKGVVGKLWRVTDPDKVSVGNCFFDGRLKEGDLLLCAAASGDCFHTFIFVREYENGVNAVLEGQPEYNFGAYESFSAAMEEMPTNLSDADVKTLREGGEVDL